MIAGDRTGRSKKKQFSGLLFRRVSCWTVAIVITTMHQTSIQNLYCHLDITADLPTSAVFHSLDDQKRITRRFAYLNYPPSIDSLWPLEARVDRYDARHTPHPIPAVSSQRPSGIRIAVVTPALAKNFKNFFPALVSSIKNQTLPPDEFVVLLSGIAEVTKTHVIDTKNESDTDSGPRFCEEAYNFINAELSPSEINVRVFCLGERVVSGLARNMAARIADSDILVFIDDDDQLLPMRNEVVLNVFECRPSLKLFLHSKSVTNKNLSIKQLHRYVQMHMMQKHDDTKESVDPSRVIEAKDLVPTLMKYGFVPSMIKNGTSLNGDSDWSAAKTCVEQERGVTKIFDEGFRSSIRKSKAFWRDWYPQSMALGHIVVRREVFDYIQYDSMPRGQDQLFLRQFFSSFMSNETALFLDRPLTSYNQQAFSAKLV